MKRLLYFLLLFFACMTLWGSPAIAQGVPTEIADSLEAQVSQLSFSDLPAFESDGFMLGYRESIFQVEGQAGLERYDRALEGLIPLYDPAREWVAGQFPDEVIKLGDLMFTGAGIEQLTLDSIGQMTGIDIENFQLGDVPFLSDFTLSDLVGDVPFLGDYSLVNLPNLAEQLGAVGLDEMLSQYLFNHPDIGQLPVAGELLSSLQVADIPNLGATHLGEMPEIGDDVIANVPGLSVLQFGQYPGLEMVGNLVPIAKQDIAFGDTEYSGEKATPKPVSGGTNGQKEWTAIPCKGGCPHIELYDSDMSPVKGTWAGGNWMTRQHRIPDGYGILGALFNEAGAYRLPFGEVFALQVRDVDETTGSADWGLAFRVCSNGLIDLGCTAYFLEVALPITTYEGGTILTGIKDGKGGATQPVEAPQEWKKLRPATPPELQALVGANRARGNRIGGFGLCGDGPGGVNFQSLAAAFSSIEGDYNSVGTYTNGGYGLGRYQYMTYRSDVREAIRQRAGGSAFLAKADAGGYISPNEVETFFPAETQDAVFRTDQTNNINQAISEGFSGSRIIERVGQIHYGGSAAPIDGNWADTHGRLTLKTYGEELAATYHSVESSTESGSKCSAPTPVEPLQQHVTGTLAAQEYGAPRDGGRRRHAGQDLDLGPLDTFQSYIGGEVVAVGYDPGGYYNYVDIYNPELDVVERVAELDQLYVETGQTIQAGQVIGQGTQTTGVVHLEYRPPVNGLKQGGFGYQGTYDPVAYLENLGVLERQGIQMIPIENHAGD